MVRVRESPPAGRNPTTTLTFLDWKQTNIFDALSVECPTRATLLTSGYPARVSGKQVSADYFQVFGVNPQAGRSFAAGEDQPGAAPVVILSQAFWRAQCAANPGILNRDLILDGKPHRIIGVLPAGGARSNDVVSHVLRSALSMLIVGLAGGLVGAFALTRLLKSLLFQVSAFASWLE